MRRKMAKLKNENVFKVNVLIFCRFAKEYENRQKSEIRDGRAYLANPVNAYLTVKRLTSDWNYVESLMRDNAADSKNK